MNDEQKALAIFKQVGDQKYKEFRINYEDIEAFPKDTDNKLVQLNKLTKILLDKGLIKRVDTWHDAIRMQFVLKVWKS